MQEIILKFNDKDLKFVLRDEADQSVMREIFKFKEYKSADEQIISAKDPILDIGAHVGFFSLYCRALNPKVKIFSVEPAPENIEMLNKHIKDNKIKGVKVCGYAISGKSEQRILEKETDTINYRLTNQFADLKKVFTINVETVSFKDFCKKNKIKKISVLKMDIEGGEYEVFENMKAEDFAMVKSVILEYHIKRKGDEFVLEEILRMNGFGVQKFPSQFDNKMGFIFAVNKRIK